MGVRLVVFVLAGLLTGTAPRQAPPASGPGTAAGAAVLAGRVVDPSNHGVEGVIVTLGGGLRSLGLSLVADALPSGSRRALTNADGRFAFFDLPAGTYSLTAAKQGHIEGAFGRARPGGAAQSLALGDGERLATVSIVVWPYAAISGTVVDEFGEPAVNVLVRAMRKIVEAGQRRLGGVSTGGTDVTDDRGVFRIDALTPGDYLVCVPAASSAFPAEAIDHAVDVAASGAGGALMTEMLSAGLLPGRNPAVAGRRIGDWVVQPSIQSMSAPPTTREGTLSIYPTTFLPAATTMSGASVVSLEAGDDRTGLSIQLRPLPATEVSGIVIGPDGPVPRVGVRLMPAFADELSSPEEFDVATSFTTGAGEFKFFGVPAGRYIVKVLRMPAQLIPLSAPRSGENRTLYAEQPLAVDVAGLSNLRITVTGGIRVTGRMNFDGTTLPKPPPEIVEKFQVRFSSASLRTGEFRQFVAAVDREGRITSNEMPPGRYAVVFQAFAEDRLKMPGWETIGGTIGNQDASNKPFEFRDDVNNLVVTLTDHPTEFNGTVHDAQGRPDPSATVLFFWTDKSTWIDNGGVTRAIRSVRPTKDGTFVARSVPLGEYFVAAVPDAEAGDFPNPEFLERVSRTATRVRLAEGEHKTIDLSTRSVR